MNFRRFAPALRLLVLATCVLFSLASASRQADPAGTGTSIQGVPPSQPMTPESALGLWKTSFGAVKIEGTGAGEGTIAGVWVYQRGGQEVIGYFEGALRGNVLQFTWNEPADPAPMTGAGYLVFKTDGASFSGRWWTESKDHSGDWSGTRASPIPAPAGYQDPPQDYGADGAYGGASYGDPYAPPPTF